MGENIESVYNLLTKLCEKFTSDVKLVKKLRTKSYEILLGKNAEILKTQAKKHKIEYPDVFTEALAWQFTLTHCYGVKDFAKQFIMECEFIHDNGGDTMLKFLLYLKKPPRVNQKLSLLDDNHNQPFNDLPLSFRQLFDDIPRIEPQNSDVQVEENEENLWEIALKEKYRSHRNWEDYGHAEPDKEPPFLSELGNKSYLWVGNLSQTRNHVQVKRLTDFIKDLKFLLVGVAYWSFTHSEEFGFGLVANLSIPGVTPLALEEFCRDFMYCGACCRALRDISIPDPKSGQYKQPGYIFAELCVNVNRFLELYTVTIMKIPETVGLIEFRERTINLRRQVSTLSAVCQIGPCSKSVLPTGVWLLNHLYGKIIDSTDSHVTMMLYSILYPCCQVYFMRFFQLWLLEGRIDDPYEEFFIKPDDKFILTRGRTYWTRSYGFRDDLIPDFLLSLKDDVLSCGKAMNMLKLSDPKNKLCSYLRGTRPHVVSCCVTPNQLVALERNVISYKFEVMSECGPLIDLESIVRQQHEQDPDFAVLVAKKRAATLKRIELERMKSLEEERERKLEEFTSLREELDSAMRDKQAKIASEIEDKMKTVRFELSLNSLKDKLIEEEARTMRGYYEDLIKTSENRKQIIDKQIDCLKAIASTSDTDLAETALSTDTFYSIDDDLGSAHSLDLLNANANSNDLTATIDKVEIENNGNIQPVHLTDAQRNKLKVMSTEFGIDLAPLKVIPDRAKTYVEVNRNNMMKSNEVFDNDTCLNRNATSIDSFHLQIRKPQSLSLDLSKFTSGSATCITESLPMSVDSTPLSDSAAISLDRFDLESLPATACTQMTDEGFRFDAKRQDVSYVLIGDNAGKNSLQKSIFSKRVPIHEAKNVDKCRLKWFLHESVALPLETQLKLVSSQLLRYFIDDLCYLKHLQCLRDYFFLQDGAFGRNICENLYEKLYDAKFPRDLINFRTLQHLVEDALHDSIKYQSVDGDLSFKINSVPKTFELGDPSVLDCLSLTYRVQWPLNILLPIDTIHKYGRVFKYLLKVNRISWVLKKIFLELKLLAKETGNREIYLMMSPQYRRLHQCRHVMLHFAQTLQNYIVGEVLEPSWVIFEKDLKAVHNLDSLYSAHSTYIKNILFLCLLDQKSTPLRKVIEKIFIVILKFYHYLYSRTWKCEDEVFIHPNFTKLESIFNNFEEFAIYFFKVGGKVVKSGYQPHLAQLLDLLDINGYYSNKIM